MEHGPNKPHRRFTKRPGGFPRGSSPRRCPKLGTPTRRTSQAGYHPPKSSPPMIPDPFKRPLRLPCIHKEFVSWCPRNLEIWVWEKTWYSDVPSIVSIVYDQRCWFKMISIRQQVKFMLCFCFPFFGYTQCSFTVKHGRKTRNPPR